MALATRVQNRVATELLAQLTNPNTRQPSTVDTTVLGYAVTDVQADFETFSGVTYDDTDERHVAFGVRGVLLYLRVNQGRTEGAYERLRNWQQSLNENLRLVTGNNRITPKSSSALTPSDEAPNGATVRPYFDERVIDDIVPTSRDSDGDGLAGWM